MKIAKGLILIVIVVTIAFRKKVAADNHNPGVYLNGKRFDYVNMEFSYRIEPWVSGGLQVQISKYTGGRDGRE